MKNKTLQSMTGFGRGIAKQDNLLVTCEIRSVNHRGLDVKMRLPRELFNCESDFLRHVQQSFNRGRIDININVDHHLANLKKVNFDAISASCVADALFAFAETRPKLKAELRVSDFLALRELFVIEDTEDLTEKLRPVAEQALELAIADVMLARKKEGENLFAPISESISSCQSIVGELCEQTKKAPKQHFEQLLCRVQELTAGHGIDGVRLAQEAAFLADKSDVTEEIGRLLAHFNHFKSLCESTKSSGRKLDFLCQEMFREANTVGSKCADTTSAHLVVELKAEIERLREQVQNVE